jgi:predicted Zn-dependent protease
MAVSEHRLETFRVLNGLAPKDALKPGQKVKLVVD